MQLVDSAKILGQLIRRRRRELGMSQVQLALSTKTGERYIVELERGKPTCQLGKALQVAHFLGIRLIDQTDRQPAAELPRKSARQTEAEMLNSCVDAARGQGAPSDQREANIFLIAGTLVSRSHPTAALALRAAGEGYFKGHAEDRLMVDDVVRRGWVPSLPRLRDNLAILLDKRDQRRKE